jgi:hypothetical protein
MRAMPPARAHAFILALFALALAAGCGTLKPSSLWASPPTVTVAEGAAVMIAAGKQSAPHATVKALGRSFEYDRDAFSRELARLVTEALREAGADVATGPEISVQVDYLDFIQKGPCFLDYRVSLGGAEPFGMQSRGESSIFEIACGRALENAVADLVADPRTRSFMEPSR